MPNGRSGGFIIEKTSLVQLVKALPEPIGAAILFVNDGPKVRPIDALEMVKLLESCRNDRLAVEEQDRSSYIIHISNQPEIIWILVMPESEIYAAIRERHKQWTTANQGWNEWIAF